MTKFRAHVSLLACATALVLSGAAWPGTGHAQGHAALSFIDEYVDSDLDLPEPPKPSIAQKGNPSPPTAQSRLFSYRLDLLAPNAQKSSASPPSAMPPMGLPSGHAVSGMKTTTSPAPAPRGAR